MYHVRLGCDLISKHDRASVLVQDFDSRGREAERVDFSESEAILFYKAGSFRTRLHSETPFQKQNKPNNDKTG